ncbi:MAG TPA: hypothetical protein DHV42_01215 [Lachnospiraceae bacterium]|nr:hypothetical protein [Lachnospiraceae bacterium]
MGNMLRHAITVFAALILLAGVPVYQTRYFQMALSGVDAVSSATMVLDQPSGEYVVMINRRLHPDKEKLAVWKDFFQGKEIGFLFEDITCVVADNDPLGLEIARSFQSRLPENQMSLRTEDLVLMRSKADHGRYDIMLLSKEIYEASGPAAKGKDDIVIESSGAPGKAEVG